MKFSFLLGAGLVLMGADSLSAAEAPWKSLQFTNQAGRLIRPFAEDERKATVLVFVAPDCPISNQFAPELQRLHQQFEPRGVRFHLVYPDPTLTSGQVRAHLREFHHTMPALLDPRHELVNRTEATVTPEAVVLDGEEREVYKGRINNRYVDFGRKRLRATRHDLQEVLEAVARGGPVKPRRTQAVGCYIDTDKP